MRIDIGSNSLRPELILNKNNIDSFELNNRGENVRGKIIDVNLNMVLIQTNTGKEFLANTTIPMENFIGQEMLFTVIFNQEGQLFLKPQLDQKKQEVLNDLKVEDLLVKLGKSVTPENKEIVAQMVKSGIAINKESFKEIKDLFLSLKILQNHKQDYITDEQESIQIDKLVRNLNNTKNESSSISNNNPLISKEIGVKEIVILKNFNIETNTKNLKALHSIINNLNNRNIDIFDINKSINGIIKEINVNDLEKLNIENQESISKNNLSNLSQNKNININDIFNKKSNFILDDNNKKSNTIIKDPIDLMKIAELVIKRIHNKSINNSEDLKLDLNKIESELKKILISIEASSKEAKKIEKEILPKVDLLKDLSRNVQYQILPFQIDNYENVAQYYIKKNKRNKKNDEGISVAVSIDTHNVGNVRALLSYKNSNTISINIATENKIIEEKFKKAISLLQDKLTLIGYSNVVISTNTIDKDIASILDEIIYKNIDSKSFEMWV